MDPYRWTCPFCNHASVVTDDNFKYGTVSLPIDNKHGARISVVRYIVCPNPECKEFTMNVSLHEVAYSTYNNAVPDKLIKKWSLLPPSHAKVFPNYIPKAILDDYQEACLIKDLSPKASATLSRRCLQGIIRDFWGVKKTRLVDEIEAIKDKIDPLTWDAIDAVRKIGNIGAHMEKDIDLIIDVEPDEASLLIELIETLLKDWYITRYERQQRLKEIVNINNKKEAEKKKVI